MEARGCSSQGREYLLEEKYVDALAFYNQVIAQDPGYAPAYANRGVTHMMLGHIDEAYADFTRANCLDDQLTEPLINRGFVRLIFSMTASPGHIKHAEKDLQEALKLDRKQIHAHLISAMVAIFQGKTAEARKSIDNVQCYTNKRIAKYYDCGLESLANGKTRTALHHFEVVWQSRDIDPRVRLYSGILLLRLYNRRNPKERLKVDLWPLMCEMVSKDYSPGLEKLCLVTIGLKTIGKTNQMKKTCWEMLSEHMPEFLPGYLREEYFRLLIDPNCWGWPKEHLLGNKKLADYKTQLVIHLHKLQDRRLKLNAYLQLLFPQTLLGDIFATARPRLHFFAGETSILVGRLGGLLKELQGWIKDSDYDLINRGTLDALDKAREMNPQLDERLKKYYPRIYDLLRIKMKQGIIQGQDEGNKYIGNLQL